MLVGFTVKYQISNALSGWSSWVIMLASVGTATILAPVILMPQRHGSWRESPAWQAPVFLGVVLFLLGLFLGPKTAASWLKALAVLFTGLFLNKIILHRLQLITLPGGWEKLEHVVGMICIALALLIMGVYLT